MKRRRRRRRRSSRRTAGTEEERNGRRGTRAGGQWQREMPGDTATRSSRQVWINRRLAWQHQTVMCDATGSLVERSRSG